VSLSGRDGPPGRPRLGNGIGAPGGRALPTTCGSEPPPQRHVQQRNGPVRRVHCADDEQIRRHAPPPPKATARQAELLARIRQRYLDLVGRAQPLVRLDQRDQLAEAGSHGAEAKRRRRRRARQTPHAVFPRQTFEMFPRLISSITSAYVRARPVPPSIPQMTETMTTRFNHHKGAHQVGFRIRSQNARQFIVNRCDRGRSHPEVDHGIGLVFEEDQAAIVTIPGGP
jgi:hypothetical protein